MIDYYLSARGNDMVGKYRRGRIAEKKVVNYLAGYGFTNIRRSRGSRGPADIYAKKGDNRYYIQVKTGTARVSSAEIKRLRELAKRRHGTAVVIEHKKGKNRWKFFGHW